MRIIGNDPSTPRQAQIVASGTLPSGKPVIVNADGTVSVAGVASVAQDIGSAVVFSPADDTNNTCVVYDSAANKIVVAYVDIANGSKGKASVGTVSGTSISFGSAVTWHDANTNFIDMVYDANAQKVVIAYYDGDNSGYGTSVVGTVSGTSISFGTTIVFNSANVNYISLAYSSAAQKVIVSYRTTSDQGQSQVGTVSGTSISYGGQYIYNTGVTGTAINSAYDVASDRIVVAYKDEGNSNYGTACVGSISGTAITWGSETVFNAGNTDSIGTSYDPSSQKIIISYRDRGNSNYGTAIVGTVSGTSISFGSEAVFSSAASSNTDVVYHSDAEFNVISWRAYGGTSAVTFVTATVSGTSLTFSSATELTGNDGYYINQTYDTTSKNIISVYRDDSNTDYGTAVAFTPAYSSTNLTSENYIGISQGVAIPTVTGAKVSFESSTMGSEYIGATYDPDTGKIILAYQDEGNSFYGTAVVGTVSGTSISFGTPVVFQTSKTKDFCAVYDTSNDKVVITYCNEASSDAGTGIVGTVSGTSISFGSPAVFDSNGASTPHSSVYDTNAGKVVVFYRDTSDSSKGKASVGTVSGTSISWGSLVNFNGNNYTNAISAVYDSTAQKIVVCFADVGNSTYGSSVVGTVSGTSISFGTKVVFSSSTTQDAFVTYDSSNNKSVVTYKDGGDSDKGKVSVATVSGTSISFGTPVTFVSQVGSNYNCAYDTQLGSVIISYGVPLGQGKFITGTVSGTSIGDFSSPYSYYSDTNRVIRPQLVIDGGTGNAVFSFKDQDDSNKGSSTVTSIGFAGEVADGDNAAINLKGAVAENQSGLTAGQSYYVQTDGTLGTTPADPSVFAGTAVAATKLIVKG